MSSHTMSVKLCPFLKIFTLFLSVIVLCESLKYNHVGKTYQKGFKAYSGERWSECIKQFEESIHLYKLYSSVINNCRLKCSGQGYKSSIEKEIIGDLKIYEKFFNIRDCLLTCQDVGLENVNIVNELDDWILSNMQRRKPYEYLHVCYFQMNALPRAASATYTYLVANPNDETMKKNLQYYIEQPEVDIKEIKDLESENYMTFMVNGLQAYKNNQWEDTVQNMEKVLTNYFSWENNCRAECERQPQQEWSPEFFITVSNIVASLLHCRQQCQDSLKTMNYNSGIEFIADVLNHLQISYYHLNKFENAAEAVSTYLMLLPIDEDMLENKKIYSTLVNEKAFKDRSDVVFYFKQDNYEKNLLKFFHKGNNDDVADNTI